MAAILAFTKSSNLPGKRENYTYLFTRVVQCDRNKHFAAFGSKMVKNTHFYSKLLDLMLFMTSYLVTIASDCRENLQEHILKTAYGNDKSCSRNWIKTFGGGIHPPPCTPEG